MSAEARLQEVELLYRRNMLTEQEYTQKREQILREV
jgi:hypothetical protein